MSILKSTKYKNLLVSLLSLLLFFSFFLSKAAYATDQIKVDLPVTPCTLGSCPKDLIDIYNQKNEPCVDSFERFKENPYNNHFWIDDPQITAQGKADERARQFLYWTLNRSSIDDHPPLLVIWNTAKNVALFLFILAVAIMGLGMIISQQANFTNKIPLWPSLIKIGLLLLYIVFSGTLVILLIKLSDVMMKFFIENLGGKELFNIYFSSVNQEKSYIDWIGCRDLNYKVQEAIDAELFILKVTNVTYYVMGAMILLRKILLWFLLFVSPFLALLVPFVFIRNIGWIWIGVFFQWLFYGPLFALFLGGLATIWKNGIPFNFDFSRVNSSAGYVFPTGINILYGGPAQLLNGLNNGNYVDTFVEYVITLLMLWAVTFFPWWLLRIFRDYCCEGIYAMKNILMSMYDQMRGGPSPQPPLPTPSPAVTSTAMKIPRAVEIPVKIRLETIEEIKKAKTEEITRSLNLSVSRLTDIAHFETDKKVQETVNKTMNYLQNPIKAETPTERQKFMNIRAELFRRAVKDDQTARRILSSISGSKIEQIQHRENLLKSVPQTIPVTRIVSIKVKAPQDKVKSVVSSFIKTVSSSNQIVNHMANKSQLPEYQVQNVLSSLDKNLDQAPANIIPKIVQDTGLDKKPVVIIIQIFQQTAKENKQLVKDIASRENIKEEEVEKIVVSHLPAIIEPEKHIEETISIPPTIPLEDYEQVKRLWKAQYHKGEVPVSEDIKSRDDWLNKDIVLITNTLNKLLSTSPELRQEGLDDISYILPIFLINNLKGEELIIYLKAKLEAAKEVKEEREKEEELLSKLESKKEEEMIEVEKPKIKPQVKEAEMKEEIDKNPTDKIESQNLEQNPKSAK